MTIALPGELTWARDLVTPALVAAVDRIDPPTARVCRYHFGWIDEHGRPSDAGGKVLRPALTLMAAQATDGAPEDAVAAAAAVELVHNFSLVHDDVMDGDAERRHRPTAWRLYGVPAAILAGDALLTVAFDVVREYYPPARAAAVQDCLSTAVRRLIAGQSADVGFETRDDVTLDECLTMAADKTSALMNGACAAGAIAVGAPGEVAAALGAFGEHLGLAFQLVDDLLGIWGSPAVTGKPALSDLTARKKTLPVLAATASETPAGDELAQRYREPDADPQLLADLVEKAGGREWAATAADDHVRRALRSLADVPLDPQVRSALELTARFVTERDR